MRVLFVDAFAHSQYDLGGLFHWLRLPGLEVSQWAYVLWQLQLTSDALPFVL